MEEVKGQTKSGSNSDTGKDETSATNLNEKIDCHTLDQLKQCGGYDESKLFKYLEELPEEVLSSLLKEINETNNILTMENSMYDFILKEDEIVQNALEMLEMDAQSENAEDIYEPLSYAAKCYFANKRLKALEKDLEQKRSISLIQTQNLEFQLESLNISLKALKEAQETFYKNVQFGGRHPVTKKVILQKVGRYFDESIKNKMAMTNRYKIQIKSDIMERNKLFSQIKEQYSPCRKIEFYWPSSFPSINLKNKTVAIAENVTRFTRLATLSSLAKNMISPRNHREDFRIDYARNYH